VACGFSKFFRARTWWRLEKMLAVMREDAEARGEDPDQVDEWQERIQRVKPWQHRDLRRTARTIMGRAGVSREIAEHCLAHALPLIERTYTSSG
jgi:tellurite resistance protein